MSFPKTPSLCTPFHLFTSPDLYDGVPLALGRTHASWFLVFATPHGRSADRALMCLNYIVPSQPPTVGHNSRGVIYSSKPHFTIGGTKGGEILQTLLSIHDKARRPPVKVVKQYDCSVAPYVHVEVEVDVPENEVAQACARCGMWETHLGPRFNRCAGCRKRYYCSRECQKDDWKPAYHKGECALLQEKRYSEVERRRKLHDNGWWFDNSTVGNYRLLAGMGIYEYERALDECDYLYLAYGRPTPPHDVPPTSRPVSFRAETLRSDSESALPPGFIPTGNANTDRYLIELHRFKSTNPPAEVLDVLRLSSERSWTPKLTMEDIPTIPPLPTIAGFTPTGDPIVDEIILSDYLDAHGTADQLGKLGRVLEERDCAREARERLALQVFTELEVRRDSLARKLAWVRMTGGFGEPSGEEKDGDTESVSSTESMESLRTVEDSSDEDEGL